MNIRVFDTISDLPDPQPDGTYVVIDTYKFSTTVCTLLERGAASVTPLKSEEECRQMKEENPEALVGGEMRNETEPREGFAVGNSPAYVETVDVADTPIGLHSENGAETVRSLTDPDEVYLGSTVNAAALALRLRHSEHEAVNLLTAGRNGQTATEDIIAAILIHRYLNTSTIASTELQFYKKLLAVAVRTQTSVDLTENADYDRIVRFNSSNVLPRLEDGVFVDASGNTHRPNTHHSA